MKQSVSRMVSNTVALVLLQAACQSAAWAEHPHYMHAISDLRTARALLSHGDFGNVVKDCGAAVSEINACIHDLETAAWYDGKNVHDNPPPDVLPDRSGRLNKSIQLLQAAHNDMAKEEDDPAAVGFRNRAIHHVDRAMAFVHRALGDKYNDEILKRSL